MKRLEIAVLTAVIGLLLATGTRGQEEPPPQTDPRAGVFADTLPYESQYAEVLGARSQPNSTKQRNMNSSA